MRHGEKSGSLRTMRVVAHRGDVCEVRVAADVSTARPAEFSRLLGYILAQAVMDGMSAVAFEADEATGSVRMRYRGVRPEGETQWWDMTAPPPEAYSPLVRAIVEATTFEPGIAPRGAMRLLLNKREVVVRVNVRSWRDIELALEYHADER